MNETLKHFYGTGLSLVGFMASITLDKANRWAALICAIVGTIAGLMTIANIIKKWVQHRRKEIFNLEQHKRLNGGHLPKHPHHRRHPAEEESSTL